MCQYHCIVTLSPVTTHLFKVLNVTPSLKFQAMRAVILFRKSTKPLKMYSSVCFTKFTSRKFDKPSDLCTQCSKR